MIQYAVFPQTKLILHRERCFSALTQSFPSRSLIVNIHRSLIQRIHRPRAIRVSSSSNQMSKRRQEEKDPYPP